MFTRTGTTAMFAAGVALALVVSDAPAFDPPDQIPVTGIVRDFKREHPDFDVTPAGGNGHFASMVSLTPTSDMRPQFSGNAFKVNSQWRDSASHNIPPHLYSASGVLNITNGITYNPGNASIDTWDSDAGPYGGSNVGPAPVVQTGGPIPVIVPPTGLPNQGNLNYGANQNVSYTTSFQCNSFQVGQNSTVTINGHLTIYCTGNFTFNKNNKLNIAPDSSLKLYVGGLFKICQGSWVNMIDENTTGTPSDMKLYAMSSLNPGILLNQGTKFCGQIFAPNCTMQMDQNDHFYGTFWGLGVNMDQGCGFHFDGMPQVVCGITLNDTEGTAGVVSFGGVTSAATFEHWYKDTLGQNLSAPHTIMLTRNGSGVYEYLNDEFFPIDGILFGNEGDSRNFFFTYTFAIPFVHHACSTPARFFQFQGADDAWVYIDDHFAMDLGGVLPGVSQRVPIDRLELVDGQTYTLRLFYAQRNPTVASFNVSTNLDLVVPDGPVVAGAGWD